ncbi:ELAVprotein 2:3:4 [Echinococcus multilocularis]|uniref:ELAVprotein 2:3:4 n=1 Tax=Echinococcus multilocularis TaxID=6211 RepID=A0A068XUV0_ECHMU|nr:ELAVprotein 2:3:4 [Echinococcus multilocularis]
MDDYTDDVHRIAKSHTHTSTSEVENKTNLIVNYLPPNTSQEEVRSLFAGIGELENCKLVREKSTGESLGYAFVKYYNAMDAKKAIDTFNGLKMENKTIKVSIARPSCDAIKGANLYICGLPRNLKISELEDIFRPCGRIITTRILCDKKTSASRGIAFIRYDRRSEAERAIKKLNGYKFPETNDIMMVKFANSPSSHSDSHRSLSSRSTIASSSYRRRKKLSPASATSTPQKSKYCDTEDLTALPTATHTPRTSSLFQVKVPQFYNLEHPRATPFYPPTMSRFGVYGNEYNIPAPVNLNRLFPNPSWQRTQLGFCQLAAWGYLQHPMSLSKMRHSMPPYRGEITTGIPLTNFLVHRPSPPPIHIPCIKRGNIPSEIDRSASMKALLAPAYAANAGALTTNGWCIVVHNLGADTDDAVLWQLFGPFGAVHTVNAVVDPMTGKCKGYGFVTMSNYEEALKAIQALSGFILDNRILQVSFKTKATFPNYLGDNQCVGKPFHEISKRNNSKIKRRTRRPET